MLLIDGVRYQEWTDLRETEDLEPMIQKHAKYIFGEKALYIDRKQKLRSLAGTGSIPDAYVISPSGDSPHWHIVEIELSYKDPGRHLVTQLNDFINGMKNSRNEIVSAINQWIKSDDIRTLEFKHTSKCEDIHEFLSELIKKDPILTIIIERKTEKLKEAIEIFEGRYKTEIVEFRTFRREGAETVHAHLFEPRYTSPLPIEVKCAAGEFQTTIRTAKNIDWHYLDIPGDKRPFFPEHGVLFTFETDVGEINTKVAGKEKYFWIQRNLLGWYEQHPELRVGDKIRIIAIEPMKRYRLEIVK